jgi:hypothetical protein
VRPVGRQPLQPPRRRRGGVRPAGDPSGDAVDGLPADLRNAKPLDDRELYPLAAVTDQHDVGFGMAVFMLRMIAALRCDGVGIVRVAAGSTAWELRSHVLSLQEEETR